MINPYFCYCLAFLIALLTYLLRWSDLYPKLSASLIFFLFATIALFSAAAWYVRRSNVIVFQKIAPVKHRFAVMITMAMYVLWSAEFWYAGGIPFVEILLRRPFDYRIFGIPSLHVFIVTFGSFYTIFLFHEYLSSKSRTILVLFIVNLFAAILIYNRGMLFFNLAASALIYLNYARDLSRARIALGLVMVVGLLYVFGVLGSLRTSREARKPYSNEDFLAIGGANEDFRKSMIPAEFFWSYIYISSPLANFQTTLDAKSNTGFEIQRVPEWFSNEVLFDFISKRLNSRSGVERESPARLQNTPFNVATIYARSFTYLGWPGLWLMALTMLLAPVLLFRLIPVSSPFFLTALAILNTMYLFAVFDNTFSFTGLSFQLVYPVALALTAKKVPRLEKYFSG